MSGPKYIQQTMESFPSCCARPQGAEGKVLAVVMKSRMSSLVLEGIFCRASAVEEGGVLRTVLKEGKGCAGGQGISAGGSTPAEDSVGTVLGSPCSPCNGHIWPSFCILMVVQSGFAFLDT